MKINIKFLELNGAFYYNTDDVFSALCVRDPRQQIADLSLDEYDLTLRMLTQRGFLRVVSDNETEDQSQLRAWAKGYYSLDGSYRFVGKTGPFTDPRAQFRKDYEGKGKRKAKAKARKARAEAQTQKLPEMQNAA